MKGRQRARIILNGTWFVQQTSADEYIVYHEYYDLDFNKHLKKVTATGCIRDAIDYIMDTWWMDIN